jgi:hypothetical protein
MTARSRIADVATWHNYALLRIYLTETITGLVLVLVTRARLPNRGCGSMLWLRFARPRYGGSCLLISFPATEDEQPGEAARGMMGA